MSMIKRVFRFFILGGFLGGLLTTWLAPKAIAWYFNPPVEMGFNCMKPIEWSLAKLQLAQGAGVLGGGLIAVILALVFMLGKKHQPYAVDEPTP
jgi:hypothetical protein